MPYKTESLLYAQLSNQQRKVLADGSAEVVLEDSFASFTGNPDNLELFQASLNKLAHEVKTLALEPYFISGYVRWSNDPGHASKLGYRAFVGQLKNGIIAFLKETGRTGVTIQQFDSDLVTEFVDWIKSNPKNWSPNTGRRYLSALQGLFEGLERAGTKGLLPRGERAPPNHSFPDSAQFSNAKERLDDISWQQLVNACRSEITEIVSTMQPIWDFLDSGLIVLPDETCSDRTKFRDVRAVLCWLRSQYGNSFVVPLQEELAARDRQLAAAVYHTYGKRTISRAFYPSAYDAFVFALMHAIRTFSNSSPLFALQEGARQIVDVLGTPRVVFDIEKGRGPYTYRRSFALQEDDPLSPNRLHEVMARWTASIRPLAGEHNGHSFLFVSHHQEVRGFFSAKYDGKSSDSAWNAAARNFAEKHNLSPIVLGVVRTTGLDIVRAIRDDDIRAIQAAGGQKSAATVERHYEGAAARRRREEKLVQVMITQERWAQRSGRPDMRGASECTDNLAATPGWNCFDPFDSPLPSEQPGRLCRGFGACPSCPLAFVDLMSAYALARLFQLVDEIKAARFYVTPQRWESAFQESLETLQSGWIPLFTNKSVQDAATRLELEPIGALE
ncbi:hypothetical protein [Paraburkholderia lacunae]|uniref:Core-binding (CB) domain-containing protein n=1 Tax=Paraburkholderia lacunae TaxID=2211104 RepID=A0A370MYS2_9BURK|nr:hypothetical protein [Paraburkholderia lacunae]RDJ98520.1 hypothetical protein DLM46_32855 [Paraburkholderia lacunae]